MPRCVKCREMLAPNFIENNGKCFFCNNEINHIDFQGIRYTKRDAIKEYDIFMKKIKEDNQLLRDVAQGKATPNLIIKP